MSQFLQTEQRDINGRVFTVRVLTFAEARKVYSKIQRLLVGNEEVVADAGVGLFMFAGLAGAISDEEMKLFIDTFGPTTSVALDATRTLDLGDEGKRNLVFGGHFEDMFAWLDFCVDVNFAVVMEKLRGARQRLEERTKRLAAEKISS